MRAIIDRAHVGEARGVLEGAGFEFVLSDLDPEATGLVGAVLLEADPRALRLLARQGVPLRPLPEGYDGMHELELALRAVWGQPRGELSIYGS